MNPPPTDAMGPWSWGLIGFFIGVNVTYVFATFFIIRPLQRLVARVLKHNEELIVREIRGLPGEWLMEVRNGKDAR